MVVAFPFEGCHAVSENVRGIRCGGLTISFEVGPTTLSRQFFKECRPRYDPGSEHVRHGQLSRRFSDVRQNRVERGTIEVAAVRYDGAHGGCVGDVR